MINPFCPICGNFSEDGNCKICSYSQTEPEPAGIEVEPSEAKKLLEGGAQLIDVRTKEERATSKIEGSIFLPIRELPSKFAELDKTKLIITQCHHGIRSLHAARFLMQKGFNARSLSGGIEQWSLEIDKKVPRY